MIVPINMITGLLEFIKEDIKIGELYNDRSVECVQEEWKRRR